jgi:hypothetical protein
MQPSAIAKQFLRAHGWLTAVEPAFADALLAACHLRSFERADILCEGGSLHGAMVGIVSGQVGVRWVHGSSDSELALVGLPGSWWGGAPVWGVGRDGATHARTHVEALQIDLRDLRDILNSVEGGWRAMGLLALDLTSQLATAHDDMMTRDIRRRCMMVLLRFAGQRRRSILPLPPAAVILSQEELARAANLTRSPVSRILHELETRGLVRLQYRSIEVVDPKGLAALAEAEWG